MLFVASSPQSPVNRIGLHVITVSLSGKTILLKRDPFFVLVANENSARKYTNSIFLSKVVLKEKEKDKSTLLIIF